MILLRKGTFPISRGKRLSLEEARKSGLGHAEYDCFSWLQPRPCLPPLFLPPSMVSSDSTWPSGRRRITININHFWAVYANDGKVFSHRMNVLVVPESISLKFRELAKLAYLTAARANKVVGEVFLEQIFKASVVVRRGGLKFCDRKRPWHYSLLSMARDYSLSFTYANWANAKIYPPSPSNRIVDRAILERTSKETIRARPTAFPGSS
jgi:hypothetical protein